MAVTSVGQQQVRVSVVERLASLEQRVVQAEEVASEQRQRIIELERLVQGHALEDEPPPAKSYAQPMGMRAVEMRGE